MIIITGGAGMVGSVLAWHLNQVGRDDLILVDHILHPEQWQNLVHRRYINYLDKDELELFLNAGSLGKVEAVVHMGAISATTERNFNLLVDSNIRYSQMLWTWCAEQEVPFLYASSAATYGDGELGYADSHDIDRLRPLNGYGYSKHFFDQWVLRQVKDGCIVPPRWYGFKLFNVYGPNEYHKERMASVVYHTVKQTRSFGHMNLFRSHKPNFGDGMQMRDFVYVKDVAQVIYWFMKHSAPSGLYNVGSGKARSFFDLACAAQCGMGLERAIEFIDMPEDLKGKYQYFTEANIGKLRSAGYNYNFSELEAGVADYVKNYLMQLDYYC